MGCVYIDPCSTILLRESNTHNFKNLAVGSTIFFYFFSSFLKKKNRRSYLGTCIRIALRLLKIIKPILRTFLVEQNRMANAQLLGYGSEHLGQNFFFY
jgi:hypothetical protein